MDPNDDRKETERQPMAGGVFLLLSLLIGIIVGVVIGEVSAGMVIGLVVGIAAAVALWLIDRRRA